ncbi:3-phosphoshikimate 1-carboxyvinyltransferase [Haloferula sp. A504]|uniref:3-phosphoshikimate 1-carboxyvinyltransferase n=1 Tax=Haloferula sp. A504 TaxID=3373601 RepID=UPI0031C7C6BC|nr:3-phosphoshikimate 1-carboxyvinyltransferase [Verrucomicrobiaceae bacterium E54]
MTDAEEFRVQRIERFDVDLEVPGDKSISHRVAMIAGLARGASNITGFLPSEDCLNTLNAMRACGVAHGVREEMLGFGPTSLRIEGRAMRLAAPSQPIDCGNSGTGMRLLAGLLAGQSFGSELFGDASLSGRPMGRITTPLREMGAEIETLGEKDGCAPLKIHPAVLTPIRYELPVASAQVKSAVLLAGLFCEGTTTVVQPATTRDHTERMFEAFGIRVVEDGNTISIDGGQVPVGRDFHVPGDISSAAFWVVAAAVRPGCRLVLRRVGLNPTRTAILDVIERMGATVVRKPVVDAVGEPYGDVEVHGADLQGTDLLPEEIPNLIDEIPVIAVASALASGRTRIRNARELRVKETDRIATTLEGLRAMGASVEEFDDGMEIEGGSLNGATVKSYGDHRIAMAFAMAGLHAAGETRVIGTACVRTSYPGFSHQLAAVQAGRTDAASFDLPIVPVAS